MSDKIDSKFYKSRSLTQDLTIYIPTKNRTEFLRRLLYYYSLTDFRGFLYIGDSSEGKILDEDKKVINEFSHCLNIKLWELPGVGQGHAAAKLVREIKTSFATLLCDDDLILTRSIELAIRHLSNNPDVAGVNGKAIFFSVTDGMPFGEISNAGLYPLATIAGSTSLSRMTTMFQDVKNMNMCISRTDYLKEAYEKISMLSKLHSNYVFEELIHGISICGKGEIYTLNDLFLCRQFHHNRFYGTVDRADWLVDPEWQAAFSLLKSVVVQVLKIEDGLSEEQGEKEFKKMFFPFLSKLVVSVGKQYEGSESRDSPIKLQHKIRMLLRKIELLHWSINKAIKTFRSIVNLEPAVQDLEYLLSESSPFHEEFLEIYNVVKRYPS